MSIQCWKKNVLRDFMNFSLYFSLSFFHFPFLVLSASLLKNTGLVVANDAKKERTKALVANIHRLGEFVTINFNLDTVLCINHTTHVGPMCWSIQSFNIPPSPGAFSLQVKICVQVLHPTFCERPCTLPWSWANIS